MHTFFPRLPARLGCLLLLMLTGLAVAGPVAGAPARAAVVPPPALHPRTRSPLFCGSPVWSRQAPYPIAVEFPAVVAQGGQLYSFGGSNGSPLANAYRYDPAANTWTALADLPVAHNALAVSDGSDIYILAGTALWRYDPSANSYTILAPPPLSTAGAALVYLAGRIYRISGLAFGGNTPSVDVYTLSTNNWSPSGTIAPYPQAESLLQAVAADGYIYAGGGFPDWDYPKAYRYDPVSNMWDDAVVPDPPAGRWAAASTLLQGQWVWAGGAVDTHPDGSAVTLDLNNLAAGWTALPPMPATRNAIGGATIDTAMYAIGGDAGNSTATTDNQRLTVGVCPSATPLLTPATGTPTAGATPTPPCDGGSWTLQAGYPLPIAAVALVAHGGRLYSFGGRSGNTVVADAYQYDATTNYWTPIAPLPVPRTNASAVSDGTYVYILNGEGTGGPTSSFYRYDPATNTYTTLVPIPLWTDQAAVAYLAGRIYRLGGDPGGQTSSRVEVYTISTGTWAPAGTVQDYPLTIQSAALIAANGYLYAAGGYNSTIGPTAKSYRYDPGANSWSDEAVADLPSARESAASALLTGRWILAGGLRQGGYARDVTALDLSNPIAPWSSLPDLLQRTGYAGSGSLGSALYVVGGTAGTQQENQRYLEPLCPGGTPSPTGTRTATGTPSPPATTRTPTATGTAVGTAAATATGTRTATAPTATPTGTRTATTPTATPTANATGLPATATAPAATPTASAPTTTATATRTSVPPIATATATPCLASFSDVHSGDYFATPVQYLACHGILSGYSDGTFRPYNATTRAQLAKIVVGAAGWPLVTPPTAHFSDVPPGSLFYAFVETAFAHGIVSGYSDGTFQPGNPVTRGQLAKIIVAAQGWPLVTPAPGHFRDVPSGYVFYPAIETAFAHGLISGYSDGTFRPGNPTTRGQIAKIVYGTVPTP